MHIHLQLILNWCEKVLNSHHVTCVRLLFLLLKDISCDLCIIQLIPWSHINILSRWILVLQKRKHRTAKIYIFSMSCFINFNLYTTTSSLVTPIQNYSYQNCIWFPDINVRHPKVSLFSAALSCPACHKTEHAMDIETFILNLCNPKDYGMQCKECTYSD